MIERPLIFIPGIWGSTLAVGDDVFWPPTDFSPSTLSDVLDKLGTKIRTNIDEDVPVVAKDVFPYSVVWGGYNVMLMSSYWGYTLGSNFWTFPYDWRQSNDTSGQMLTRFIEKKIQGEWASVDIVCHSMGGFVTRAAYKHSAPIKRTVYIASPHFGNPLAYFALNPEINSANAQGFDEFIKKLTVGRELKDLTDPETNLLEELEDTMSKFPSMYELMPDDFYLAKEAMILRYGTEPIFGTNETYLNNEWKFKQDMQANVTKAMEFKKSLGETLPGNDDDILIIFDEDYTTFDKVNYYGAGSEFVYDSGQMGDSWVVTKSAMGSMSGSPAYKNSTAISNSNHLELPNDEDTIAEISRFLNGYVTI
jgi:pimeloyl-ACP methyl ester carboxylesterase